MQEGGSDRVRAHTGDRARRVHWLNQWKAIEQHLSLIPRCAADPQLGGPIVVAGDARQPPERAEEISVAKRRRLGHVGVRHLEVDRLAA